MASIATTVDDEGYVLLLSQYISLVFATQTIPHNVIID